MGDVIQVPRSDAVFRFQLGDDPDAKVWELPLMASLPYTLMKKLAKRARSEDDPGGIEAADDVDIIIEDLAPGLLDVISAEQYRFIMSAWSDASGMTPGESQGSPQS